MLNIKYSRSQIVLLGAMITSLVIGGCYKTEPIRSYSAPKESAPVADQAAAPAAPAAAPGEPTDRMLAAILPVASQAYFFKVVGPIAAVDKHEKEINDFFADIRVGDDGKPKWQAPTGWKEGAAKAMRLATLEIPAEGKPLEVAISEPLPWAGNAEAMLSNVNRWRKQLQLPEVDTAHVGENSREIKIGSTPMTIVDLRGRSGASGMMPPFAGGAGGVAPMLPGAGKAEMPAGHPPIDGGTAAGAPAASPHGALPPEAPATESAALPKFTAPADWKPEAAGGMRRAAFTIGDGGEKGGLVTVSNFPIIKNSSIDDPLQNLNMWRAAVGMQPATAGDLPKVTEKTEVDGKSATYVRVLPDAAGQPQGGQAILAAMVTTGDQVWFFKLKGERGIVAAQEEAFKNFLKSVHFGATAGSK